MAEGEHANTRYWKQRQHDAMQSTIARLEKRVKKLSRYQHVDDFLREIRGRFRNGSLTVNGEVFSVWGFDGIDVEALLDAMIAEAE
jgi:hypothetical protein